MRETGKNFVVLPEFGATVARDELPSWEDALRACFKAREVAHNTSPEAEASVSALILAAVAYDLALEPGEARYGVQSARLAIQFMGALPGYDRDAARKRAAGRPYQATGHLMEIRTLHDGFRAILYKLEPIPF